MTRVSKDEVFDFAKHKLSAGAMWGPVVRKTLERLPGLLDEDEELLAIGQGRVIGRQSLFVTTDKRTVLFRTGFWDDRVESFPHDKVTSVHAERRFGAKLTLSVAGSEAVVDAVNPASAAEAAANVVRAHMSGPGPEVAPGAPVAGGGGSAAEELGRLADLKDRGVLSEDEFEDQKRRLLG